MDTGSGRAALQIALLAASVIALASWPTPRAVDRPTPPPAAAVR